MMTAPFLSDAQLERLAMNPEWGQRGHVCPTCLGADEYVNQDGFHVCEPDGWGMHAQHRLYKLYATAFIPFEFQTLDWALFPEGDAKDKIDLWVQGFERARYNGRGFGLYGNHGTGKSWAAAHCLMEVVKQGYSGLWMNFRSILRQIDMAKDEAQWWTEQMEGAEVLVLDEIRPYTTIKQEAFYSERLEQVLLQRAQSNFPTLTTTNMTAEKFRETYPRIAEQLSHKQYQIEFDGESYRPQADMDRMVLDANGWVNPIV